MPGCDVSLTVDTGGATPFVVAYVKGGLTATDVRIMNELGCKPSSLHKTSAEWALTAVDQVRARVDLSAGAGSRDSSRLYEKLTALAREMRQHPKTIVWIS